MVLKEKAINGVLWNSLGNFTTLGIEFIVGIFLARILTPREFGLIGTITVVIVLSEVMINSGFSQALVRKQDCTQKDFSTVFFFNLLIGILFFIILFFSADALSVIFKNKELKPLIQVLGIGLIISAFTLIQSAKLIKRVDFKLQTKITLISSILSGSVAIAMAFSGFGVWSLVVKSLLFKLCQSILLWVWNKWKPDFIFDKESFKQLFGFGSKLMLSGLIGTFFQNVYYLLIARYFTQQDLGYFTRAEMFKNLPSQNVTGIVTAVAYPILATLQNDRVQMKGVFRQMFVNTFFVTATLMCGMMAIAKALIITLVGEKWIPSVILLQMLSVVGLMMPINSMNVNILNVVGRSDLYLKLQTLVQLLIIPNVFVGLYFGIKFLIVGMIFISFFGYIIFNHESKKVLNYPIKEQIKDIFPSLLLALTMGLLVFGVQLISHFSYQVTLILQLALGFSIVVISGEFFKMKEYVFIKTTLLEKIQLLRSK